MEFGLDVVSKYISTCASCEHNRKGECGFIDRSCRDDGPRGLTLAEYEEMTSTELELMDTRCTGNPCSKQLSHFQLSDAVESRIEELDPEITPEFAKRVISQCYKLVERARRNDGSCGGGLSDTVEAATQIVLSHLDWRALEQGKNINLILRTYEYGYERKTGLFRYCSERMAINYLEESKPYDCKGEIPCTEKLIYDPKWQDMVIDQSNIYPEMPTALINRDRQPIDRSKTQSETDLFGMPYDTPVKPDEVENNQSEPVTAVDSFRKIFTDNDAHDFIDAILAMHDFSFAEPYWEEPEHRSLFIITSMEDAEKFIFHRWGELREEISSRIKAFKYRDEELTEYLKSLLAPAYSTFLHLYPKGNDLEHREARFMLDVFATTCVTSIDYFKDMWMECRAEAKRYVDNFVGGDDEYIKQIEDLIHQKHKAFIPYNGCKESWALFNIRSAIFRFIFTVEGCLIENMIEQSIFDYQEKFDTPMVGKITDLDLCLSMDWSVCMVDYYLCEVGHNIETLPSEDYKNVLEWATTYSQHDFYEPEQLVVEEAEENDGYVTAEEEHEQESSEQSSAEADIEDTSKSALQDFLDTYVETGEIENFIEANLLYIGLDPYSPNYEVRKGDKNAQNTIKKFKNSYSANGFFRLDELKEEISSRIHLIKEDECQLEQYVCSLLEPFQSLMFYFFPQEQDLFCSVCKETIDLLLHAPGSTFEIFSKDIIDSVHEIKVEHAKDKLSVTEFSNLLHDKYYEKQNGIITPIICPEKEYIERFVYTLRSYAGIIEGALLENGVGKSLLYYQEFCGVKICEELDLGAISEYIGWTYTRVESAIKKYHHDIIKENKEKQQANNSPSENTGPTNHPNSNQGIQSSWSINNVGKSKCAATKEKLICHKVETLLTELVSNKYATRDKDGKLNWIKDKETYAYFCFKLTNVFVGEDKEIEVKFISENLVSCQGNLATMARYANRYKNNEKSKPDFAAAIDNLIVAASNGMFG